MEVDATLEGMRPFTIHGSPYVRVFFSHLDDPETILDCQLPEESIGQGLRPGDPIVVTYLLRTVMAIAPRATRDPVRSSSGTA